MANSNLEKKINLSENIEAYLYAPKDYKGAVVFCADVFGIEVERTRSRSANFAENGYICILPDCIGKDPLVREVVHQDKEALPKWIARHPPVGEECQTALGLSISYLEKNFSLKKSAIFMVGACYGGKALLHALGNPPLQEKLGGGIIAHGSFMEPSDIELVHAPLLVLWAEKDSFFDYKPFVEGITKLQATRKAEGKSPLCGAEEKFKLDIVSGADHGFWAQGSEDDSVQKYASKEMLQWLSKFIVL